MRIPKIFIGGLVVLGVALLVPWRDNPAQYRHWRDRIRTAPLIKVVLGHPCATYKDNVIMYDPGPSCYRYGPQQIISGIWLYEFEGAVFFEGATKTPKRRVPKAAGAFLLNIDPNRLGFGFAYDAYNQRAQCYPVSPFALKFVGRRRLVGHSFGGSDVIVDRIVSAKPLPSLDCRLY